jgi:hypothetical protein
MSQYVVKRSRGGPIAATIGTIVVALSVTFAIQNLINRIALIPSILWLTLLTLALISSLREAGFVSFCRGIVIAFCRRQFLEVKSSSERKRLEIGSKAFAFDLVEHRIAADDLVELTWRPGQGSDMAGRDVGDWSLFLWYRHGDQALAALQKRRLHPRPEERVVVIGTPQARETAEQLARDVWKFLSESGVSVPLNATLPIRPREKRD